MLRMNHRRALTALAALAVASAAFAGSGANFNSASANPTNVFTAGNLLHTNSKAGAVILAASKMKPGDPATSGTVDITNSGDIPGTFTLRTSSLTNTPATPAFSSKLNLVVTDLGDPAASPAPAPVVKYTGTLGGLSSAALGTFAVGVVHRYKFDVSFPDGGTGGADNVYKAASTSVEFDWESTN